MDRFSCQTMLLLLNVDDSQSDSSSSVSVAERESPRFKIRNEHWDGMKKMLVGVC